MSIIYGDLHRRAGAYLRGERRDHTLQPTALVNEVYLRLARQGRADWKNRAQFFAVSAQMMRRILVDYARARAMAKRSGRWLRVTLDEGAAALFPAGVEVLDLDASLTRLETFDARKSRIVELRFFGGMSLEETAHVLNLSLATVERDWQVARAWLNAQLKPGARGDAGTMARDH